MFCEYRERKKPGLRAGYGKELEQRLDRLEEILKTHSEILQNSSYVHNAAAAAAMAGAPTSAASVRNSIPGSLPSDHGTPREPGPLFRQQQSQGEPTMRTPQAETALFLQKPSSFPPTSQSLEFGGMHHHPHPHHPHHHPQTPSIHSMHDGFQPQMPLAGISPPGQLPALQPSAAAQEYYGTSQQHQQHHQSVTSPGLGIGQGQSQAQISSDQDLPPYDLLYALADLYFKHINTWCPILHRKTTLDSLFGPSTLDETDRILLHAIVATTLRYSTDPRLTEERRRHYHRTSKQRVILYGMENSSVKSLQAMVILALDLCGDSNGPPGWNLMALITRSVVQLGLAVESNSFSVSPNYTSIYTLRAMILPEPRDFIEEESRRRLFWMVYLLDRYATLATAFEFALDDREIDRTLPCRDDLWIKNQKVETRWFRAGLGAQQQSPTSSSSPAAVAAAAAAAANTGVGADPSMLPDHDTNKPENLGAFSYYIEILGILSQVHKFLKQPVDISALGDVEQWQMRYKELDQLLTGWKFGLPGEYGNMAKLFQPGSAKSLTSAWVMLHATYHTAVIRLHSSAAYPTTRSPIFTPSYSASQRCHGAVENIAALGEFAVQHGMLSKLGPPFAFTLWVAARLLLVHGSTVEHKLSPQIGFLVDTLREMGRWWPVAARYCELLQRVLDEHSDSERAVGPAGERVTPSSVRILADMRRTAFDLDFLISRQPRHLAGAPSRVPSVTPARTPAPNELEYLDVFDFFNVPRLPFTTNTTNNNHNHINNNNDLNSTQQQQQQHTGVSNGNDGAVGGGNTSNDGDDGNNNNNNNSNGNNHNGASNGVLTNEFNITNFMMDASSDWLFKAPG